MSLGQGQNAAGILAYLDGKPEHGAHTDLALDPDPSVHELDQLATYGHAQTGASVLARGRRIDLLKRLEDLLELFVGDADARVVNGEGQLVAAIVEFELGFGRGRGRDCDVDLTALGELDRVIEQIDQNLAHPRDVADDRIGHVLRDAIAEVDALLASRPGHQDQGRLDTRHQLKGLLLEFQAAGLDLGKSRMSLRMVKSAPLLLRMVSTKSRCLVVSSVSRSRLVMPTTAFMGVRIS